MSEIDEEQNVHEAKTTTKAASTAIKQPKYVKFGDVVLRLLLFVSSLVGVLVMIIDSNQTETVELIFPPFINPILYVRTAKVKHWPAFIYLASALSLAGLYSIITLALSSLMLFKRKISWLLLSHLIMMDVVMLGIVSSATGAGGAVAYIGLEGNSHTNWTNICDTFDHFCLHIGISLIVSLFASILLVLLLLLNITIFCKKIPK